VRGTDLITGYLAELQARLPAPIVEELADGLEEAVARHRGRGLDDDTAARAAVTEFGDPAQVAAGFVASCPGRRLARQLLLTGPVAGLCWGTLLIAGRAWMWPVPDAARAAFGAVLLGAITLLVSATIGHSYRRVTRAAAVGSATISVLDATMIGLILSLAVRPAWIVAVATAASGLRIVHNVRGLPRILAADS
jgi:hypothetical protein